MNSRERVLTAFAHQEPDRVPMWCGASQEFWDKAKRALKLDDEALRIRFHDDVGRVTAPYKGKPEPLTDGITYRTPFGIDRHGQGYGQPISHPLAEASLTQVHDYPWPSAADVEVSAVKADTQRYNRQYAILGGDWSPFWHDAIDMLGMETLLIKMYTEPAVVDAVFSHIVDYYAASSQHTILEETPVENVLAMFDAVREYGGY